MANQIKDQTFSEEKREIRELFPEVFCERTKIHLGIRLQDYTTVTDKWHRHNQFYEMVIGCGESARNENDAGSALVRPGDLLLFAPGSIHRYTAIHNFRHYNLLFGPELLKLTPGSFATLPGYRRIFAPGAGMTAHHLGEKELSELVGILEEMRSEFLAHSAGWEEAMFVHFSRALIYVLRHCEPASGAAAEQNTFQISRIIRFMEEHSTKAWTLKQLASRAQMSESSFRHHFSRLTGLAPIEYLIRLRLRRAALLLQSQSPIAVAAIESGFSDTNYFCRQFRARFSRTPREFRSAALLPEFDLPGALNKLMQP